MIEAIVGTGIRLAGAIGVAGRRVATKRGKEESHRQYLYHMRRFNLMARRREMVAGSSEKEEAYRQYLDHVRRFNLVTYED